MSEPPSPPFAWSLLFAAVVAEVVGTTALKLSDGMRHTLPTVVVFAAYGAAFLTMSFVLRTLPVAIVYAVWSGLGIALTAVIGWVRFREVLRPIDACGLLLILAGVVVLARSRPVAEVESLGG